MGTTTEPSRHVALDKLERKADHLKDTLNVLDRLTGEAGQLLDVLGHTLYELGKLTAPINQRATALTIAQTNVAAAKQQIDELIDNIDTSRRVKPALEQGAVKDLEAFLDGLHQLEASNSYLQRHHKLAASRHALGNAQKVFDRALEQCGAEFAAAVGQGGKACLPSPAWLLEHVKDLKAGNVPLHPLMPEHLLPRLQKMAHLVMDAGFTPAHQSYVSIRTKALQQALQGVGQELPTAAVLQTLPPDQLERVITGWVQRLWVLILLMVSERHLAIDIWGEKLGMELYGEVVRTRLQALVATGRELIEARRSGDKLFVLLDMHRHITSMVPVLESILSVGKTSLPVLSELQQLRGVVATSAASLFSEYEDSVARDGSKVLPMDGTIHPLTAKVVSYVKRLLNHTNAAEVLYGIGPRRASDAGGRDADQNSEHHLSMGVAHLLMQLINNLETKSRQYKEQALASLFMMNNVHYVQWSVENSNALGLLGQQWLERHKDLVEDFGAKYHDLVWMPLVNMLQRDAPSDLARLKQMLKDNFMEFNTAIERIYTSQSGWTIPDHMLRDAVKRVIKDDLVPPYEHFLRQYADVQFTNNPAKYIKYAVADVVSIIDDDLFETKAVSMNKLSLKKEKLDAIV